MELIGLMVIVWLVSLVATPMLASGRGHSGCLWFFLAFLFGPLALLVAAVLPPTQKLPR